MLLLVEELDRCWMMIPSRMGWAYLCSTRGKHLNEEVFMVVGVCKPLFPWLALSSIAPDEPDPPERLNSFSWLTFRDRGAWRHRGDVMACRRPKVRYGAVRDPEQTIRSSERVSSPACGAESSPDASAPPGSDQGVKRHVERVRKEPSPTSTNHLHTPLR